MMKWQLKDKIIMLEAQIRQLVETNLKLTTQLGNLWDEIGSKNDYIREQKFELAEVKVERNRWKSKWSRCVARKWEKVDEALEEKKKREEGRAIIEKALSDERTDN
jgi:peptidoglycan hydrolase CwlO-like protein